MFVVHVYSSPNLINLQLIKDVLNAMDKRINVFYLLLAILKFISISIINKVKYQFLSS